MFDDKTRPDDPSRARYLLRDHLHRFLKRNIDAAPVEGDVPALGLKVSAGLGKTRAALEVIAELGAAYLKTGHILFYVPTHDLAEEAAQKFRELGQGAELPSVVLRGRSALHPETERPMCQRWELAEKLSGKVVSITKVLCRQENNGGETIEAPCAQGCPYLAQSELSKNHVIFLPHSYLTAKLPIKGSVSLRVIDEKFWGTLVVHDEIHTGEWTGPEWLTKSGENAPSHVKDSLSVRTIVMNALNEKLPIHDALSKEGFDEAKLRFLGDKEREFRVEPKIHPRMRDHKIRKEVDDLPDYNDHHFSQADIFYLLANTAGQRTTDRLNLAWKDSNNKSKNTRVLRAHYLKEMPHLKELPLKSPYILLDADLNETITRKFFPRVELVELQCRSEADVIQVENVTFSGTWLKADGDVSKETERCKGVLSIIEREVEQAEGKVLVVATKRVLKMLYKHSHISHDELPTEISDEELYEPASAPQRIGGDPTRLPPLQGADVRWFGPRMLGINDFEGHSTIVVVGRMQPPVEAVEESARALFGDSDLPLQLLNDSKLVAGEATDAQGISRKAQIHPDDRVQVLLKQVREAATEQAIARLRLINPKGSKKRVLILSNLPLPTLLIDSWVTFPNLTVAMPSLHRLRNAIKQPNGTLRRGISTSATGLHKDAPHEFKSRWAAKSYIENYEELAPDRMFQALCYLAKEHEMEATEVTLTRNCGGPHPASAVVFAEASHAVKVANELWPNYSAVVKERYDDVIDDPQP